MSIELLDGSDGCAWKGRFRKCARQGGGIQTVPALRTKRTPANISRSHRDRASTDEIGMRSLGVQKSATGDSSRAVVSIERERFGGAGGIISVVSECRHMSLSNQRRFRES